MTATATLAPRAPRIIPWSRMGDESLAARAADGNQAASAALVERYHGPLLGYCRSILLNSEDAQDATQTALEKALRNLPRREAGRPLKPWLYRIAHNEAINIVRRRQPRADADPAQELTVPGPEVDAEQRGRLAQLVDDLRLLPERQRGALVMRELSGLSYDDIGLALGVSNEAARRAVFDARSALHDAIDGRATACVSVRRSLSDGDRRSLRARGIRAHLRSCQDCATFEHAIDTRRADLVALGPWLHGAAIGLLGLGGAGGGALIGAGGGTSATVGGGLAWAGLPVAVKGLAVAAVVATSGTAAVQMKPSATPDGPPANTKIARVVVGGASPALDALRERARAAAAAAAAEARRARRMRLRATGTHVRGGAGAGASTAASARGVPALSPPATAGAAPVPRAPIVAPVTAQRAQPPSADAPAVAPRKSVAQLAIEKLGGIREQITVAFQQAQQTAAPGTAAAIEVAATALQATLGTLRPVIDRILATVGLSLPAAPAALPPSSGTAGEPGLSDVLAPAKQVLGGVTSLLDELLGSR